MKKRKWSIEEVDDYRRMHNMYFYYYNKGDGNLLVPKMSRIGYTGKGIMGTTANLAHPVSKICALVLLILAFLPMFLKLFSIIP